ncbi:unnamed protein product [Lepeophtheirus salmonis]|uniref:(salmon louse) hypothetical protein n=1 Tax=Lepeophtheirus salmonis TaxID=72036 RepID=A0A7R8CLG9_LEPSM|nr:unnamed protein product [Lepeophtheirus salmonis]CAF2858497.1 unnamed protein product [Lepeophtheirus salmonis]
MDTENCEKINPCNRQGIDTISNYLTSWDCKVDPYHVRKMINSGDSFNRKSTVDGDPKVDSKDNKRNIQPDLNMSIQRHTEDFGLLPMSVSWTVKKKCEKRLVMNGKPLFISNRSGISPSL